MHKWLLLLVFTFPSFAQTTPPASNSCPNEFAQFYSVGAGIQGLGPIQPFGYYSASQHIACGTYITEINEYARVKGGTLVSCARAGASKILFKFKMFDFGIVGDAGACEGTLGNAGGAFSERGFAHGNFGWFQPILSAEKMKIAGNPGQDTIITLGFGFGK